MHKTRFKGHETFYFREGWISKALFELNNNHDSTILSDVKSGIAKLGVGANMVKSIKYWLTTANLVKYNKATRKFELTALGRLIANYDVYLEDELSLWLIHYSISSNYQSATTWYIFWNYFKGETFDIKDVENYLKYYLDSEEISYNENSLENDIAVLLQMYSKNLSDDPEENTVCPLSRLHLITQSMNEYEKEYTILQEGHELIILYILCNSKDEDGIFYYKKGYIKLSEAEELLEHYLNLTRIMANEYIDVLKSRYINIINTAGLDMIYFNSDINIIDEIRIYYEGRI